MMAKGTHAPSTIFNPQSSPRSPRLCGETALGFGAGDFGAPAAEEEVGEGEPAGGFGAAGGGFVPEVDFDAVGEGGEDAAADLADEGVGEGGGTREGADEDQAMGADEIDGVG